MKSLNGMKYFIYLYENIHVMEASDFSLVEETRKGIDKAAFQKVVRQTNLPFKEFTSYLHVSGRMIQSKKAHEKLPLKVTEHTLFIKKLYEFGVEIFGDVEKFNQWMRTPNPVLGNEIPKSYLDTISGIMFLRNKLNEIAHGFVA
jgi:putative toxin-antitoxin system antitoxin component (TIGR02293 family)